MNTPSYDVILVPGPGVEIWPSPAVQILENIFHDLKLKVAVMSESVCKPKGVLPLPLTGGILIGESIKGEILRYQARSIVRFISSGSYLSPNYAPEAIPGWRSPNVISLKTAEKIWELGLRGWDTSTVIWGAGNRALAFGSKLLETGLKNVFSVDPSHYTGMSLSGWETEKRRFETLGGIFLKARPTQIIDKAPQVSEIHFEHGQTQFFFECSRIIVAGPFSKFPSVRESPPGSCLYEFELTSLRHKSDDVEGWMLEEERARLLGVKIAKNLLFDLGGQKENLEKMFRRAKQRLKNYQGYHDRPFSWEYDGKWISSPKKKELLNQPNTPKSVHKNRLIASIECFEEIACNLCETHCPEKAIEIIRVENSRNIQIKEQDCTSCGACLEICPSRAIVLVQEPETHSMAKLTLNWRDRETWTEGESVQLINRKNEDLGIGRILKKPSTLTRPDVQQLSSATPAKNTLYSIELPSHLLWEARGIRKAKKEVYGEDNQFIATRILEDRFSQKIELYLDGQKRYVTNNIPLSLALYEMGRNRPEDSLVCNDGSCGLCEISVGDEKILACQVKTKSKLHIDLSNKEKDISIDQTSYLCPCLKIERQSILDRIKLGQLKSPEAVLAVTPVGNGQCHGQLCIGNFKKMLVENGLDCKEWIDWRFPWVDWNVKHN